MKILFRFVSGCRHCRFGADPMAIGRMELDGHYYYPLARTVIGGLTASTFLTLVILPYIYVLFDNLAEWAREVWRASEPAGVVATTEPS